MDSSLFPGRAHFPFVAQEWGYGWFVYKQTLVSFPGRVGLTVPGYKTKTDTYFTLHFFVCWLSSGDGKLSVWSCPLLQHWWLPCNGTAASHLCETANGCMCQPRHPTPHRLVPKWRERESQDHSWGLQGIQFRWGSRSQSSEKLFTSKVTGT